MKKIKVNILTSWGGQIFMRQMPPQNQLGLFEFFENCYDDIIWDIVVVQERLTIETTIKCKKNGLIFIAGEPPFSKRYSSPFLQQFSHVISSHTNISHPSHHPYQQSLNWHFGVNSENIASYDFERLSNLEEPIKNKKISIISSGKTHFPGHIKRFRFFEKLHKEFENEIDFFGKNINPIADKAEGLLNYKFSIAIENSHINNYWTEKIADCYLAYTVPIYHGCKNIDTYFNPNSYIELDINKPQKAFKEIEHILENSDQLYNEKRDSLKEARSKLMNEYNIFTSIIAFYYSHINNFTNEANTFNLMPSEFYIDHHIKNSYLRLNRFLIKKYYHFF